MSSMTDQTDITTLSERKQALLSRILEIHAELDALAVQVLDAPEKQQGSLASKYSALQAQLAMVPVQVCELERRRVLAILESARDELAALELSIADIIAYLRPFRLAKIIKDLEKKAEVFRKSLNSEMYRKTEQELSAARQELVNRQIEKPDDRVKKTQLEGDLSELSKRKESVIQSVFGYFPQTAEFPHTATAKEDVVRYLSNPGCYPAAAQRAGQKAKARAKEVCAQTEIAEYADANPPRPGADQPVRWDSDKMLRDQIEAQLRQ